MKTVAQDRKQVEELVPSCSLHQKVRAEHSFFLGGLLGELCVRSGPLYANLKYVNALIADSSDKHWMRVQTHLNKHWVASADSSE
jgi:hypothetical protein